MSKSPLWTSGPSGPSGPIYTKKARDMPDFNLSEKWVIKLLAGLKPHKATGPDQACPKVLREIKEAIAPTLQVIFIRSLETGKVRSDLRHANVVPIYKKGSKHLAVNYYRPGSLTCICSKLMERIMVSQISRHLVRHKLLLKNQHGFRSFLSCDTQLLEFIQELHTNLNQGRQVDAVIRDFSKTFDKVAQTSSCTNLTDTALAVRQTGG